MNFASLTDEQIREYLVKEQPLFLPEGFPEDLLSRFEAVASDLMNDDSGFRDAIIQKTLEFKPRLLHCDLPLRDRRNAPKGQLIAVDFELGVLEIFMQKIPLDRIKFVVMNFEFDDNKEWNHIIAHAKRISWDCYPEECGQIANQLRQQGKLRLSSSRGRIPFFDDCIFVQEENEIRWNPLSVNSRLPSDFREYAKWKVQLLFPWFRNFR